MSEYAAYIICTAPRSGSTLLCRMLKDTGVAGAPKSLFFNRTLDAWMKDFDVAADPVRSQKAILSEIFDKAIIAGKAGTPVFGLRQQALSFPHFQEQLAQFLPGATSDMARIEQVFGKTLFIRLQRKDKLDQAVSFVKAEQSGLWHRRADGRELERSAPPADPIYDADRIRAHITRFTDDDTMWRDWFAQQGVTPLHISYETLSENPKDTLSQVLEALGKDPKLADKATPSVARLADATSRAWIRRFRAEVATKY